MKNKYGAQPGCITVYVLARCGWPGRPTNLTDRHEYKVNWCSSLPHSPTYVTMSHIQAETTAGFVRHTRHILTACVLDRYSFVSPIDVLSLDGSFLVPSSMYSLVTKAQTTPKLQTDSDVSKLRIPPRRNMLWLFWVMTWRNTVAMIRRFGISFWSRPQAR